jgi:predicted aspartyl protease
LYKNIVPGLLLIYVVFCQSTSLHAAAVKDCQLKQYASLDLAGPPNGNLLVPVTLKGSHAFMILNTSSAFSTITESAASRLALQVKTIASDMQMRAGGKAVQKVAWANGLAIGNVAFKSIDLVILSNIFDLSDTPVIGMLGMNAFSQVDVELDAANRKLNLYSQDHCPGHVVYWSKTYDSVPIRFGEIGEFYFPMKLDGKKLETTLATGNPMTSLATDATRKLYNFDKDSPGVETETDAKGTTTAHYRAMKLSGEGIEIINAQIRLIDQPAISNCYLSTRFGAASYAGCFGAHPLELGRDVLTKLRIYIATKEKVLYFTRAGISDPG